MKKYLEDNQGTIINPTTGEIMDFDGKVIYIQTEEQRRQTKEYFDKAKSRQEQIKIIDEQYKEYGSFIWNVYSITEKSFPQLKPSSITRLIFLSTYLNYEGYLMNTQRIPLTKETMFDLLKISKTEFNVFYKEMLINKILSLRNEKIYINKNLFGKGKLHRQSIAEFITNDKYITRLYIDGVRELYNKSTPRSHKTLSYLFQILPYVNRQYNIVCFNPLETDLKQIRGMSLGEFCETIGYDKNNSNRLFKTLFEPQFNIDGQIKTAMRYVVDKGLSKQTYSMFINPRVYYSGNKWKEVEVLGKF